MRMTYAALGLIGLLAPALAHAEANDTAAALQQILDARPDHFESLKGAPQADTPNTWRSTIAPPGMNCTIASDTRGGDGTPFSNVRCTTLTGATRTQVEAVRTELKLAFVRTEPTWVWVKNTADWGVAFNQTYAGPAMGHYFAAPFFIDGDGDDVLFGFQIDDTEFDVTDPVELIPAP